jgi:translation initiation factor 2B subunit (eIF-2B alpha/beta/delta family)
VEDHSNRASGSVHLAEESAGRIKTHLDRHGTAELNGLLDAIVAEHPAMALGINMALAVSDAIPSGREAAAEALETFMLGLVQSRLVAAAEWAALVHEKGWLTVATYSRSGQVRECLGCSRQAGLNRVVLSEGRPANEGVMMAGELRGEGFEVTLTTDSALPSLLPQAQAVVVGADAFFEGHFVNKTGTASMLREAREAGLPTVVVTAPQKHLDERGASLWRNLSIEKPARLGKLSRGISWAGDLFEAVPWALATQVIGKTTLR